MFNPGALGNVEYSFIAITPSSTQFLSGSTCLGPIYGSNSSVSSFNVSKVGELSRGGHEGSLFNVLEIIELCAKEWISLKVLLMFVQKNNWCYIELLVLH